MEVEAKYRIVAPLTAEEIEGLNLDPYLIGPRAAHELHDTILDTGQLELIGQQYALRLRRTGGRTLLSLKGAGQVEGALHRRPEWQAPVDGEAPLDRSAWPEEILQEIGSLIGEAPLQELLYIDNHRLTWNILRDDRWIGELALDRGRIRAGSAERPLHELEFELKHEGSMEDLVAITSLLVAQLPLEPEHQNKLQRGLALLGYPGQREEEER